MKPSWLAVAADLLHRPDLGTMAWIAPPDWNAKAAAELFDETQAFVAAGRPGVTIGWPTRFHVSAFLTHTLRHEHDRPEPVPPLLGVRCLDFAEAVDEGRRAMAAV
jgi:hypothetical protein